jgi:endonuclease/exonuclease/phosphatase family metal-dependent hydrolase
VVVHLHLSTFDRDGELRRQELDFLREHLLRLAAQGHHPIAGGDFNHAFPGLPERAFPAADPTPDWFQAVPAGFLPAGFAFAFDPGTPSLRATNRPYRAGVNFLTVVDGFLVGPGIRVDRVQTSDLGFAHSDHQPVRIEISLAGESPGVTGR